MLIIDMPSPFGKDGYPDCTTCELRFYCQKPELIDCPIKGELVRCGECKHGITAHGITDGWVLCSKPYTERGNAMHRADWFCADGEKMK